jgi:CBS domain-containing protein
VLEAGSSELVVTYPDETVSDAIARLVRHGIGRLPVVDPKAPTKVVGYLGQAGILAARERYHHEEDVRERGGAMRNGGRRAEGNG